MNQRPKMFQKPNLVVQEKKLPKNANDAHNNWLTSTEGKGRLREAAEHQTKVQGFADDAMVQQKKRTGSTGMTDAGYLFRCQNP